MADQEDAMIKAGDRIITPSGRHGTVIVVHHAERTARVRFDGDIDRDQTRPMPLDLLKKMDALSGLCSKRMSQNPT